MEVSLRSFGKVWEWLKGETMQNRARFTWYGEGLQLASQVDADGRRLEDERAVFEYLNALNELAKDKKRFSKEVKAIVLDKLESPFFERSFDESSEVQKEFIHLMARIYSEDLHLSDILTLYSMVGGKADIDLHWSETKKILASILRVFYWEGVLSDTLEQDLVLTFCRLLCEMGTPAAYFTPDEDASHAQCTQTEEHLLSEYCLRVLALSECLMDFGSVGDILWQLVQADVPHANQRVITCMELFRRVCDMLPGDGFEFRGFLGLGNFLQGLCLPYVRLSWERCFAWAGERDACTEVSRWVELVDSSGNFYFYNSSTNETRRRGGVNLGKPVSCWGVKTCLQLLLSMSYEDGVRHEIQRHDFTEDLLQGLQQGYGDLQPGRLHREIALLLAFNVACCFDSQQKMLRNEDVLDKWLSHLALEERKRIAHAFMELAPYLPSTNAWGSQAFDSMYALLARARSTLEDPEMWMACVDVDSSATYYCQLYDDTVSCPVTTWTRPCVSSVSWKECFHDDTFVYFHFTGKQVYQPPQPLEENRVPCVPPLSWTVPSRFSSRDEEKISEQVDVPEHEGKRAHVERKRRHHAPSRRVKSSRDVSEEKNITVGEVLEDAGVNVPDKFRCKLTKRLMRDPVSARGHVFDKQAIEHHLRSVSETCPVSGKPLSLEKLKDERQLRNEILLWHIKAQERLQGRFNFDLYEFM